MLATLLHKTRQYKDYRRVFVSHADVNRFRRLRNGDETSSQPVAVRVREAGGIPLLCRPGTVDAITLWDAYHHKYHLPCAEIECNSCIVSLGANAGYTTANMGWLYPDARIVAVEMDTDNFSLCRQNVAHLGERCNVVQAAIWSEDAEVSYNSSDRVDSFHIDPSRQSAECNQTVQGMTLETLFKEQDIQEVDYLKMDIEGAEAAIFESDLSWAERVRTINVEIHPPATFERCKSVLEKAGFQCERHHRHHNSLFGYR